MSCACSTKKAHRRRVVGVTIATDDGIRARGTLYDDGSIETDPATVRKAADAPAEGFPVTPTINDPRAA